MKIRNAYHQFRGITQNASRLSPPPSTPPSPSCLFIVAAALPSRLSRSSFFPTANRLVSPNDRRRSGRPTAGTSGRRKEEKPSFRRHICVVEAACCMAEATKEERIGDGGRSNNEHGVRQWLVAAGGGLTCYC